MLYIIANCSAKSNGLQIQTISENIVKIASEHGIKIVQYVK